MIERLITFDPGAHLVAWAAFASGRLERCGLERDEGTNGWGLCASLERRFRAAHGWGAMRVLVELPQVYQQRGWKGDPNDLIDVAVTAGRIAQAFGADGPVAEFVRPHAWKGNAPKTVMAKRIEARLDEGERLVLHATKAPGALRHNLLDAIGLGLHTLGRLGK